MHGPWRHCNGRILNIYELYLAAIQRICFKHHLEMLPSYFVDNNMPAMNASQLQNRITRISLEQMYNYKEIIKSTDTYFKASCYKIWNSLPFEVKTLPYSNKSTALRNLNKLIKNNLILLLKI